MNEAEVSEAQLQGRQRDAQSRKTHPQDASCGVISSISSAVGQSLEGRAPEKAVEGDVGIELDARFAAQTCVERRQLAAERSDHDGEHNAVTGQEIAQMLANGPRVRVVQRERHPGAAECQKQRDLWRR